MLCSELYKAPQLFPATVKAKGVMLSLSSTSTQSWYRPGHGCQDAVSVLVC